MKTIKNDISYELMFGIQNLNKKPIVKYTETKYTKNIMKFYKLNETKKTK